ncbi:unnamed protein product [Trifolium pratense]|uniref:Uncharacterized protein n=1 Tax=Trifolium pratense TaxID=57577 RepID=A0ACB0I8R2_TRIPR|nr:unnamed protein product [Trifolium pratense]
MESIKINKISPYLDCGIQFHSCKLLSFVSLTLRFLEEGHVTRVHSIKFNEAVIPLVEASSTRAIVQKAIEKDTA